MIKYLLKSWKEFLNEGKPKSKGGLLPLDVIDFLIQKYAKNPGGPVALKRGYFDFNEFGSQYAKDFENTAASYLIPAQMLLINVNVVSGNAAQMIDAVLHEIQHYNQHMRWTEDESYRERFSKGFKLPPGKDISEIDWISMTKWWNHIYPYDKRPQEMDAFRFAEQNYKAAVELILSREKELKSKQKGATVKKNVRKV